MKEKIKYTDDSEHEFDVFRLGIRKVQKLIDKYLPLDKIKLDKDKNPILPEDFKVSNIFELMVECAETIKGIDVEKIQADELGRIYNKYFEKSVMMGLGGKGDPN